MYLCVIEEIDWEEPGKQNKDMENWNIQSFPEFLLDSLHIQIFFSIDMSKTSTYTHVHAFLIYGDYLSMK